MSKSTKSLVIKLFIRCILGFNLTLAATLILGITNRQVAATSLTDQVDRRIYHRIVQRIAPSADQKSMGNIIQEISQQLLGAEYQAGLLDQSTQETLVISLQKFDCLLFIETVLAIAQNINQPDHSYQAFTQNVENQRYWNGTMNGYCSRLHYFSDWIADNENRGNVKNITRQLGGVDTIKKLNFMTTHRSSYPNLAQNEPNFNCLARVEASLTPTFNYIPTENISQTYSQLQPGDIIGVATKIPGLDFTHTGFVYQQPDGNMGLIHASPAGEVVIAQDLQKYIGNVQNAIGIVVSRASSATGK
ncbi:MAG: N-acetylmuramoyl-L-alanine amidase-like domain-containing protein [Cyanobacteria bacterium P01_C01_bin.72]